MPKVGRKERSQTKRSQQQTNDSPIMQTRIEEVGAQSRQGPAIGRGSISRGTCQHQHKNVGRSPENNAQEATRYESQLAHRFQSLEVRDGMQEMWTELARMKAENERLEKERASCGQGSVCLMKY